MALSSKTMPSAQIARRTYNWYLEADGTGSASNTRTAAATESLLVLDKILLKLEEIRLALQPLNRLNCGEFISIPRHLRHIARDANRRNRRVDLAAQVKRRKARLEKKHR